MKKWSVYFSLLLLSILSLAGCGGSSSTGSKVSQPATVDSLVVTPADSQLTVTWSAVVGATSYEVYYGTSNSSSSASRFTGDSNDTDTSCIVTGLANGSTYYVWVNAINSAGTSGFSSSTSSGTPAVPVTIPPAPASPTVTSGDSTLAVTWTPVTGATNYRVFYSTTSNNTTATEFTGDSNTADTACTITGLTNGTPYYVWVKAVNSAGDSSFSPASLPVTPAAAIVFTVNAATGDDTNGNGTTVPYKTITKALSLASPGDNVTVAPGTYDSTLGETFPIIVPAGVHLIGDEGNKGNGTTPTTINGGGNVSGLISFISAAVVPLDNAVVAGFVITGTAPSPAVTAPMGVIVKNDNVTIRNNRVVNSGKSGIYFFGGGMNCIVAGNVIQSNGVTNNGEGIAFVNGTGPGVRVEHNVIRLNVIGVEYDQLATSADLGGGATGSAGGNTISGNSDIDLWTNVDVGVTISARNNFWDHIPPTTTNSRSATGFDILNEFGATIDLTGGVLVP